MPRPEKSRLNAAVEKIKRLLKREPHLPEEDPYAYVTSPKKPRSPLRSASAAVDKPDE